MSPHLTAATGHAPVLVVGHDADSLEATRDALAFGRLMNPVTGCDDIADLRAYVEGRAPHTPREAHPLPAVVVTELRLPTGDASDVLRLVRGHLALRRVPVVVVADGATAAEIADITALGATAFLDRSVAADVLLSVLRDADLPWSLSHGLGA